MVMCMMCLSMLILGTRVLDGGMAWRKGMGGECLLRLLIVWGIVIYWGLVSIMML